MIDKIPFAIYVTAIMALIGYFFTYWHRVRSEQRTARISLVNSQINDLYGPLYVLAEATSTAITTLRKRLGGIQVFRDHTSPTQHELEEWKLWVTEVFIPLNNAMEEIILKRSCLIDGEELPECFLTFFAHNACYRVIIRKWSHGDLSELVSPIEYPDDMHEYVRSTYEKLKTRHLRLIGQVEP